MEVVLFADHSPEAEELERFLKQHGYSVRHVFSPGREPLLSTRGLLLHGFDTIWGTLGRPRPLPRTKDAP